MGSTSSNLTQTRADSRYIFYRIKLKSSIIMPNVKLTYFNLRARGEPCRLLLAYGGIKYEDERIAPPWDPTSTWASLKPTTPFGQLPVLSWDGVEICQSMAAARFIAREVGLAGNSSLEQAQVDEVVDVIQDLINAWADLHVYMYATDAVDKAVLAKFPKLANLVERVGNVPNIKTWVESRPKTDL